MRPQGSIAVWFVLGFLGSSCSGSAPAPMATRSAPTIGSFLSSPTVVLAGGASTLSWFVSDADSIALDQGIGDVTGKASIDVRPAATTTYSLTATDPIGSSTRSLMVTVMPPPVISSFAATPASIGYGWPSSLSWSVTGAVSVEVEPGLGPVVGAGTVVSPLATTTYTLRATNVVASTTASTTVVVTGNTSSSGPAMPTARFYAGGAVTGGKIYVMGGSGSSVFSTLEVFDLHPMHGAPWPPGVRKMGAGGGPLGGQGPGGRGLALLECRGVRPGLERMEPQGTHANGAWRAGPRRGERADLRDRREC